MKLSLRLELGPKYNFFFKNLADEYNSLPDKYKFFMANEIFYRFNEQFGNNCRVE
ncbi:hypothetical protein D3C72_2083280 [compost metagenome]